MSHAFTIPNPEGHTFERWASELVMLDNNIPSPIGHDWRTWASKINDVSELAEHGVPNPYSFPTWQQWAANFINACES